VHSCQRKTAWEPAILHEQLYGTAGDSIYPLGASKLEDAAITSGLSDFSRRPRPMLMIAAGLSRRRGNPLGARKQCPSPRRLRNSRDKDYGALEIQDSAFVVAVGIRFGNALLKGSPRFLWNSELMRGGQIPGGIGRDQLLSHADDKVWLIIARDFHFDPSRLIAIAFRNNFIMTLRKLAE